MLSGAVANRYTEGLFAVATKRDAVHHVAVGLAAVADAFKEFPQMKMLVEHPLIPADTKLQLVQQAFRDTVDSTVYDFLRVLFHRNRSEYVTAIAERFRSMAEEAEGRVHVAIEAATPLDDEAKARLEKEIANAISKQVDSEVYVNSDLLGGYRIRIGNRVLDATLRGAMNQFTQQLLAAGASEEGTR